MFPFQTGTAPAWTDRAIHDTVAVIAATAAYRRGIGQSLLGRFLRGVMDLFTRIAEAAQRMPHARAIAIACVVVIVAAIVVRVVLAKRLRDRMGRVRMARGKGGRHLDLWSASDSLAAEGRYTEAAHALYQAVLEALTASDGLRMHPSKTSGDYQRDLRRRGSPRYLDFRRLARAYDAMIFGRGSCTADEYAMLLSTARSLASARRAA